MAGLLPGDPSHHGMYEGGSYKLSQDKPEEGGGRWYFSRKEIEENSPSRRDGIDLKKETYLRKSYCTFLQDLGMRLKVPQVTIATAIIFCHRFFLRQSHAKNDRRTIATVCMFLAGKVEETPRPLKDVILVSYEIIHKKDPAAVQRIKQKEVYEQQKELILIGERVVLATLGFDLNVHHPYKPLVEAIKKFKVAQNALAQVAWNFVNDGLRTSLCLQFKPHHIAAGAIFLAAKFLKVKLPSDGEKVWWQEFDVTPRQLEEVSNQMLELYEQNRVPPSQTSEVEGSGGGGVTPRAQPGRAPHVGNEEEEEHAAATNNSSNSQGGGGGATTSKPGTLKPASSRDQSSSYLDNRGGGPPPRKRNNDYGSIEMNSIPPDHKKGDGDIDDNQEYDEQESLLSHHGNTGEVQKNISWYSSDGHVEKEEEDEDEERKPKESAAGELMMTDKYHGRNLEHKDGSIGQSPQDAIIKKIDKDKVKAALEKRKKSRGDITRKRDLMDEDDLIERELEDGIELAAESEKTKRERKQNWSSIKASNRPPDHHHHPKKHHHHHHHHHDEAAAAGDGHHQGMKKQQQQQSSHGQGFENVEEGEVASFDDDDANRGYRSPKNSNSRKRKAGGGTPPDKAMESKQHDYSIAASHHHHNNNNHHDDRNRMVGRAGGYPDRDQKRHIQENHV